MRGIDSNGSPNAKSCCIHHVYLRGKETNYYLSKDLSIMGYALENDQKCFL
jgi:hypothetical protein